jgi:hypothetical protein
MDAVYFVVSYGEEPEAIYFSAEEAFAAGYFYVDGFDEEGLKVISYKLTTDTDSTNHILLCEDDYTTDF